MFKFEFFKKKLKPTLKQLPAKSTFILLSDSESPFPEVFQKMDTLLSVSAYSLKAANVLPLSPDTEVIPVIVNSQVSFDGRE